MTLLLVSVDVKHPVYKTVQMAFFGYIYDNSESVLAVNCNDGFYLLWRLYMRQHFFLRHVEAIIALSRKRTNFTYYILHITLYIVYMIFETDEKLVPVP